MLTDVQGEIPKIIQTLWKYKVLGKDASLFPNKGIPWRANVCRLSLPLLFTTAVFSIGMASCGWALFHISNSGVTDFKSPRRAPCLVSTIVLVGQVLQFVYMA